MNQKEIILRHLKANYTHWIAAYNLRSVDTEFGWLGHQADRVCRKLAENGIIERRLIGRYAHYRASGPRKYTEYKVVGTDKIIKIYED